MERKVGREGEGERGRGREGEGEGGGGRGRITCSVQQTSRPRHSLTRVAQPTVRLGDQHLHSWTGR